MKFSPSSFFVILKCEVDYSSASTKLSVAESDRHSSQKQHPLSYRHIFFKLINSLTTPISYFNHSTECLSQMCIHMNAHPCMLHLQIILHEEAEKYNSSSRIVSVAFNFLTNEKKIYISYKINNTHRRNISNDKSKGKSTIYSFPAEG